MTVLVDTCVWSLALRRRSGMGDDPWVARLMRLIQHGEAAIMGPIRQELLSGIREQGQFDRLRNSLQPFADLPLESADYERAAEMFNQCRRVGIQGSNTDFLICACAERNELTILTTDKDFAGFQTVFPIKLVGVDLASH